MPRHPGRGGHTWRQVCASVYTTERHCWICGRWVDQTLDPRHPMSRTADHLHQLDHDGPPTDRRNLRLAHRACNSARSNRLRRLPRSRCACTRGQACAALPATTVRPLSVDPTTV